MNNFEGGYFEFYKEKGADYASDFHTKKSEKCLISPHHLRAHYRYDGNTLTGKGVTVGIVTAYGYDGIQKDLDLFCEKYGLPCARVEIHSKSKGVSAKKGVKKSWATECALDVQWAQVFSPQSAKKCYFCESDDLDDIFELLEIADGECDVVSLSFGKSEFAGLGKYESFFEKSRALYVCASGNNGKVNYPACSEHTLSVGGTSVYFYPDGQAIGKEKVYDKSGCGLSRYSKIPEHQVKDFSLRTMSAYHRSVPDMCFFADGNLGCPVYINCKLESCVGTSIGAPCVSGLCACIAQLDRTILTKKASYFYELAEKCHIFKRPPVFFDIISGRVGEYAAERGFDICTGLGAPNFEEIFRAVSMLA